MAKKDLINLSKLISEQFVEFSIGDTVWHKSNPEIGPGIVLNWRLFGSDGSLDYIVSFGPGTSFQVCALEITSEKPMTDL